LFKKISQNKFLFSFLLSFGIILAALGVAAGVFFGIKSLSRPPIVPAHVEITRPTGGINIDIAGDTIDNDGNIIEPAIPQEIIAFAERKPLFYTFLVFGLDRSNNADVIIVASVDIEGREINLISIPRDTLVDVPRRLRKPTAAYATGRANRQGHDAGVAQMNADIQTLFGFIPDFYLCIDYQAFVRMVDAVEGVTVNVPFHMRYDDPTDNLSIDISEGVQVLNGENALHFARYRQANPGYRAITDYQRIQNQQQILRALFNELITPRTIARVPEFISIYQEYVNTNMSSREMLWFAGQLHQIRDAEFSMYTLPTSGTSGSPSWYELPDEERILELINRTVNPFTTEITSEMVSILNEYEPVAN
jgi:LCP family protein required for cell wall assembly